MNIVGLITEYNPFHKGHEYHIQKAKKLANADACIVIMSGNYVQRGTPAFIDKHSRTRIALTHGADIVFELPIPFACASAEYFATAAVTLLHKLGVVTHICFGAEYEDLSILDKIAYTLANAKLDNNHPLNTHIKHLLKSGIPYATARSNALTSITGTDYSSILNTPNNILAIEYLKALKILNSNIKPIAITRINATYHDSVENDTLYSASTLRAGLLTNNKSLYDSLCLFSTEYKAIINSTAPITEDDLSTVLCDKLLTILHSTTKDNHLTDYMGIDDDFANRIASRDIMYNFTSYSDLVQRLKTKNVAYTAVSRAVLAFILNIKKQDFSLYVKNGIASYIRLLGFSKSSSHLLKIIKLKGELTIIGQLSEITNNTSLSDIDMNMINHSIYCDEFYNMLIRTKYKVAFPNEYTRKITIID